MHWRELRDDAPVVVTLATVGVVLACALTAAGLHYGLGWSWLAATLLGLLISATDPRVGHRHIQGGGRHRAAAPARGKARAWPTTAR